MLKIGVLGAGAAGFFAAIHAAYSGHKVIIFEKSTKILSKVRISGGGRCNVTHSSYSVSELTKGYPRGEKFLKKSFAHFNVQDTINWFEKRGASLKTEADGRIFPVSDSSQTIIDVLLEECKSQGVSLMKNIEIKSIEKENGDFTICSADQEFKVNRLIICTGGSPKISAYQYLKTLGHTIIEPVPSLFTFNAPGRALTKLKGISLPDAHIRLESSKLDYSGPLLVTHWGISGPAVLKLSAFGANWLFEKAYCAVALIRWHKDFSEEGLRKDLNIYKENHHLKTISTNPLFNIPLRLWQHLVENAEINENEKWHEITKKKINKLIENLFKYPLKISGKTTFKEEFVTAGGVDLSEINPESMESKIIPGLFFAGEVLNIDGITGGFNFQAAWSTGYLAGINASKN